MTGDPAREGDPAQAGNPAQEGTPETPRIVVMGVSGCGKSTVGALVARELGLPFIDGDSLHPAANIAKMAAGTPLDDDDRRPWLSSVGAALASAPRGIVVACSALKRSYRDAIRRHAPGAVFLHLDGSRELLAARLQGRQGHFMPMALLDSQLATLEPLGPDEAGLVVDVSATVADVVGAAVARLRGIAAK
ncbi:gluconokinase [Specibacter sp. RAF43]|uniref:gluconokinase n=1 Tax=Specibacter sp. RAF43 TaxID=3233057 RepID=UPI003F99B4E0